MLINANLNSVEANDIVIVANNRQVLALKRTWWLQKPNSQLPKILSWKDYLLHTWNSNNTNTSLRFIDNIESRHLIAQSMSELGQKIDNALVDEVIKNYDYLCNHLIELSTLSNTKISTSELFSTWINKYQQIKSSLNLVDINDLIKLVSRASNKKIHAYGFKTLTPAQLSLLSDVGYQAIETKNSNNVSTQVFDKTNSEIQSAAKWARLLQQQNPLSSIAIVSPQLSDIYYQVKSIFDQEFDDVLVETGAKSYNISLGLPLTKYPLIQELLLILELSNQLQQNRIKTSTFNAVIKSVYISEHNSERSSRALLTNNILSLALTTFKINNIKGFLSNCPGLEKIITTIGQRQNSPKTLEQHLKEFSTLLQIWGFTTNRALSSVEYQLFNKYLQTSLGLNKLSRHNKNISFNNAIIEFKNLLSQVIFQAQSSKSKIQILGSLEAEGLYFDKAWVLGMTDNFLPAKLNSPKFIPFDIASEHKIPHSSYDLINKDAKNTLGNLESLADEVIFSYAKLYLEDEQLPTPLVNFNGLTQSVVNEPTLTISIEDIDDYVAKDLEEKQIKSGVTVLKDQMACAFKGFAHRLNTNTYDCAHIGLDRREQGSIIHKTLEYIYQAIRSRKELIEINDKSLDKLINTKINLALKNYPQSGFEQIEKQRLSQLVREFIDKDKLREEFTVLSTEQILEADIEGLKFSTRLDRLDEMENGDKIVFDYKTGKTSIGAWCGDSINEPQLPIYSIINKTDGAAFIELSSNNISYKGISRDEDSLPKQSKRNSNCGDWDDQVRIWDQQLSAASIEFQRGDAEVAPNKKACKYCELNSLCRIEPI